MPDFMEKFMYLIDKLMNMEENSKLVIKNAAFSFLVKGGALCLSLLTTPAFIRYFDNNLVLGVWYTLLSMLMWFLNFDLGIGNGIRNNLVKDLAAQDMESARRTISSGFFSVGCITMVLLVLGFGLIGSIDLNKLYNIDADIVSRTMLMYATIFVFVGIMLRFFLSVISSIFYALQMSAVNNLLSLCVSILQLCFVTVIKPINAQQGLVYLAAAYCILVNLPTCIAGVAIFLTRLKKCHPHIRYIDKQHIRNVVNIGTEFFACQLAYMMISNTNEFFISNFYGPQYTTEYTFYYKLTSLIVMVTSLALTPIWSVITKAIAERKVEWVEKLYGKLKLIGILAAVGQIGFIMIQQQVMDIWLGEKSIAIDYKIAFA